MGINELLQISRISVYQSPSISTGLFDIFLYNLLVWTIKNLYIGKTELVLFRSRIYIYLCNRIGLGHPLNHRKTITLHLGMPGTLDSCPSIPSFLDHQLRKTENRWIYLHYSIIFSIIEIHKIRLITVAFPLKVSVTLTLPDWFNILCCNIFVSEKNVCNLSN